MTEAKSPTLTLFQCIHLTYIHGPPMMPGSESIRAQLQLPLTKDLRFPKQGRLIVTKLIRHRLQKWGWCLLIYYEKWGYQGSWDAQIYYSTRTSPTWETTCNQGGGLGASYKRIRYKLYNNKGSYYQMQYMHLLKSDKHAVLNWQT